VGVDALHTNTSGDLNTAIGYAAGSSASASNYCTFLGFDANVNVGGNYNNSTAVGNEARVTASNQVRLGSLNVTSIGGYAGWTNLSDSRYKKNVREEVKGLEFILKLRPVLYQLDVASLHSKLHSGREIENTALTQEAIAEKERITYTGFLAQEVEKAAAAANFDFSGVDKPKNENDLYGLRYAEFVVPVIKAVQELSQQNEDLRKEIEELKKKIAELALRK
jgi:hypothetical protein